MNMHQDEIIFKLATNPLSRSALKLHCLLASLDEAGSVNNPVVHRYALRILDEVLDIAEKPELKSRFQKELIRIDHVLKKAELCINKVLVQKLQDVIFMINHLPSGFVDKTLQDPFVRSIRHVMNQQSKECEFSIPQLVVWFDGDAAIRCQNIKSWLIDLMPLKETVSIYLDILYQSSFFVPVSAERGFYQHSISSNLPCHLIQVKMDKTLGLIPKLQLGHHGLSIRLLKSESMNECHQHRVDMSLSICQL